MGLLEFKLKNNSESLQYTYIIFLVKKLGSFVDEKTIRIMLRKGYTERKSSWIWKTCFACALGFVYIRLLVVEAVVVVVVVNVWDMFFTSRYIFCHAKILPPSLSNSNLSDIHSDHFSLSLGVGKICVKKKSQTFVQRPPLEL